jgi:Na+/glutamate symporter
MTGLTLSPLKQMATHQPTMAQAIASVMELRDEQTKLLCLPVAISNHGGHGAGNACSQALSTYTEFLATHPSTFAEAG